ncbi:MAG: signal peptidase II, partial [Nakamurella sp.]
MSHPDNQPGQSVGDADFAADEASSESSGGPAGDDPESPAAGSPAANGAADGATNADEDNGLTSKARTGDSPSKTEGSPPEPTTSRHHRLGWVLAVAALVLVIDQITKIIVVANLTPGVSPRILGGLIYFSLFRNAGAAWSIGAGTGMTWILAVVACVVVVVIIRMASRLRSGMWATCLGLILGGALGNLMDRIFRSPGVLRGHVVDFISVFGPNAQHFPVFNIADSGITIGGVLLVIT